jgi:hypothetical protein
MQNHRLTLILFSVLISALFLISCNSDKPDDLIPESTYIKLIVEFEMTQSLFTTVEDSAFVSELIEKTLNHYGITAEQFARSHAWYDRDTEEQLRRYRRALDMLNEETANL